LSSGPRALHGGDAWARAGVVIGVVVALDQVTKQLVVANVERGNPYEIAFGFEISNVRNSGIAFGLLSGASDALVLVLTLGALSLLVGYFAAHAGRPELWLPVGLVVGGALGNLADRVRMGAAVDFLDPPLWPAFNVADVAIVLGVALFVLLLLADDRARASAG
jgi:signal peptidase II